MKDDILKFRKCVDVLKKEKGFSNVKICSEMGISDPTLKKLMETDIAELKPRASVLALVQDFNKKHCNDLNYADIKPAPEEIRKMRKNLVNYKEPEKEILETIERDKKSIEKKGKDFINDLIEDKPSFVVTDKNGKSEIISEHKEPVMPDPITPEKSVNPFELLLEALKLIPSNIKINISING
jgi:hypothetical protein